MKIAVIDPSLFTYPYDRALMDGLQKNGHEVNLYTKYLNEGEQGYGDPDIIELFYYGLNGRFAKKLPKKLFLAIKGISHFFSMIILWFKLKAAKPDAIHFQWCPLPVMDRIFIPLFRKIAPTVLTVHDSSPFNNNPSAKLQAIGAIKIFNSFDHLIVHTKAAVKTLSKHGIDKDKISIVAHGFLDAGLDAGMDSSSVTAEKNPSPIMEFLLFGQIKPYKGVDIIIKALAQMPKDLRRKCRVNIVGKPQMDMQPLFDMAKDLGVDELITWDLRFIGDDEIGKLLSSADTMILPYRDIDASGVLMQLIPVGRAVIASRIGLFAELLEDGKHGYLIEQNSPEDLMQAMSNLINNKDLCTDMGKNVAKLQDALPSWQEIGRLTCDIYGKACNKNS